MPVCMLKIAKQLFFLLFFTIFYCKRNTDSYLLYCSILFFILCPTLETNYFIKHKLTLNCWVCDRGFGETVGTDLPILLVFRDPKEIGLTCRHCSTTPVLPMITHTVQCTVYTTVQYSRLCVQNHWSQVWGGHDWSLPRPAPQDEGQGLHF